MRKRILSVCLALLCAVTALVLPVAAATSEFPSGSTNQLALRLVVGHPMSNGELPLEGVTYSLYKVAEFTRLSDGSYTYTPTAEFKGANVDLSGLDFWHDGTEALVAKAETLAEYVEGQRIQAGATKDTDAEGLAAFTKLSPALYLALGQPVTRDFGGEDYTWTFIPQATLVSVPFQNLNGKWSSAVQIDVKAEQTPLPPPAKLVDISVRKVWVGGDPLRSVTVTLMGDGLDVETVTLNKANNWSHTWLGVNSSYEWTVKEDPVPSGWAAKVTNDGSAYKFIITNTIDDEVPPNDDPTPPPTPTPTPTPAPGGGRRPGTTVSPSPSPTVTPTPTPGPSSDPTPTPPAASTSPTPTGGSPTQPEDPTPPPEVTPVPSGDPVLSEDPVEPGDLPVLAEDTPNDSGISGLPQTGQLWWPVPLLVGTGLVLLAAGILLGAPRSKGKEKDLAHTKGRGGDGDT